MQFVRLEVKSSGKMLYVNVEHIIGVSATRDEGYSKVVLTNGAEIIAKGSCWHWVNLLTGGISENVCTMND